MLPVEAIHELPLQIDTPLKATVFYFPQSPVLRCLNHSNVLSFRKALIHRIVKIPDEGNIEQNITVGVKYKGKAPGEFIIQGNIKRGDEIEVMKINPNVAFGFTKGGHLPKGLFGLEEILKLQPKLKIMDSLGGQQLDYEVFLKTTKGMIGNAKYNLELFGQDKIINGVIRYVLEGKGKIGSDEITVQGWDTGKDSYELNEKYGPIEISTTVRIYD